ncbi:MAG: hypothetical protein WD071_06885 [Pseudohongiella sp.]|uniref:alpha/beta hydrolase n=1 Tax=Pseudohongiella sp. TaxID=1979412 RepID=UPI0034A043EC
MQLFEMLFIIITVVALLQINSPKLFPVSLRVIIMLAISFGLLHLVFEGPRWQVLPAYIVFALVCLFCLKKSQSHFVWRVFGLSLGILFVSFSILLVLLFPVIALPPPTGPYLVGNFSTVLIDETRAERYEPEFNRGVPIQVWYPSSSQEPDDYARQSLFSQLYAGEYDLISFLTGYLQNIKTHSYINAPIADAETYPIIIFNHGLFMTGDQNPQLMEHLASHGYVIVSVSHPFESAKVLLPDRGVRTYSMRYPEDVGFNANEVNDGGIGDTIGTVTGLEHSKLMTTLYEQLDRYRDASAEEKIAVVRDAVENEALGPLGRALNEANLTSFFEIRDKVRNRSTQYWVEDISFVIEQLRYLDAPVSNFSASIDPSQVGALGHSYGGSAVGEFCKTDIRCAAASNLDGTQFGSNWNKPVQAPFLLINTDANARGNDYAYYPVQNDFFDLHIPDTEHGDLIDALTAFPIWKISGLGGEMGVQELADIVKDLELAFFDEYLKGKEGSFEMALKRNSERLVIFDH